MVAKIAITEIEIEKRKAIVYNFSVEDYESYFVSSNLGIWVHNFPANIEKILKTQKERGPTQKLTNSQVRDLAKHLGFKEVKGENIKGLVFTNGKTFITQDLDSHIGGTWKMAKTIKDLNSKDRRMGTYDALLNRVGD